MVLTVVSLLVPLAERLRLPHTVLLAIAGMGLGFLGIVDHRERHGARAVLGDAFAGLDKLEVGTERVPAALPAAAAVHRRPDDRRAPPDGRGLGRAAAGHRRGAGVHRAASPAWCIWATGIDIVVCLLLGAIVSTTDPAAVIGIFRDVGAPKRLSILAEGELLLNDAVAIAAFGLVHRHPGRAGDRRPAGAATDDHPMARPR